MENGRVMEFKLMLEEPISSRHLDSLWTQPKEMGFHPALHHFFFKVIESDSSRIPR